MIYGYCRVSTKGQAKDGNSLDAQEQEFQGTVMLIFIRKHTQELLLIDLYSMKLSNKCRKMICL